MIDQKDTPKPPEAKLASEEVIKSDRDLNTVSSLSAYAKNHGGDIEIGGGYAVEAHCDGKITRPHGDMDIVIWLNSAEDEEQAQADVFDILQGERDHTKWEIRPNEKNREHFINFLEDKPEDPADSHLSSEQKFFKLRKIELYTFDKSGKRNTVERTITDSAGKVYVIRVPELEQIVSEKVRIFNRNEQEKATHRDSRSADYAELKRLVTHKKFNKDRYLELRSGALKVEKPHLSEEECLKEAELQWQRAIEIISIALQTPNQ